MTHFKALSSITLTTVLACTLGACVYKPPVQQGHTITPAVVKQLHVGMTRAQVENRIGPPVLVNPYRTNSLHYVYLYEPTYGKAVNKRLTIFFKNGRLSRYQLEP